MHGLHLGLLGLVLLASLFEGQDEATGRVHIQAWRTSRPDQPPCCS